MTDPGLNSLLKWGVQNSEASLNSTSGAEQTGERDFSRGLDKDALMQLMMGAPSDADRMKEAMAAILSPEVDLDSKLIAFDNFEQLIENIDNTNNMESLGLWVPLVDLLDSPESELQRFAAWCVGTAVQNNPRAQERCLIVGAIPKLASLCLHGSTPALRKKAVFALSSEVRNYQPGLNELIKELPTEYRGDGNLDSADMDAIDVLMNKLRESIH